MKYTVFDGDEVAGTVYLDDDATADDVIDALESEGLLDGCDDDDFTVADEPAGDSDFPLVYFVSDDNDEPLYDLWPEGFEPEAESETGEESDDENIGAIIDGECHEVH